MALSSLPESPLEIHFNAANQPYWCSIWMTAAIAKQYATVVSNLQQYYGRAADFIPVSVDSLPAKPLDSLTEPSHYYEGVVPQTVLLDQSGKVAFNIKGAVPFEQVDDAFREVFNLLPRTESVELKRRRVNEFNTELSK